LVPSDRDFEKIFEPLQHIVTEDAEDNPLPGGVAAWEKGLQSVGLWRMATYPINKYGNGCIIFDCDGTAALLTRGYEFLACVDLSHDQPIYIGLRNAVDYINFHALIRPMLMMQTEQRFRDSEDQNGWDGGTYRRGFELKGSEAEHE
jgi:hypothetical protein